MTTPESPVCGSTNVAGRRDVIAETRAIIVPLGGGAGLWPTLGVLLGAVEGVGGSEPPGAGEPVPSTSPWSVPASAAAAGRNSLVPSDPPRAATNTAPAPRTAAWR